MACACLLHGEAGGCLGSASGHPCVWLSLLAVGRAELPEAGAVGVAVPSQSSQQWGLVPRQGCQQQGWQPGLAGRAPLAGVAPLPSDTAHLALL